MKKLMYAIAFGLTFLSVTSASRVIASNPSSLLITGDPSALWQLSPVSQSVQPSTDPTISSPVVKAVIPVSTVAAVCKGDAARVTPPIPNRPTHIRNVIWRNTRAMCLHQIAQKTDSPQPASQR